MKLLTGCSRTIRSSCSTHVTTVKQPEGEFPFNPNGSLRDIAGICDATGRIFGLMPHPEGYNHWTNHPDWMRRKEVLRRSGEQPPQGLTPGIQIFQNAVDYLRSVGRGPNHPLSLSVGLFLIYSRMRARSALLRTMCS